MPLARDILSDALALWIQLHTSTYTLELITFEILAAERLRLMGFDNRLIIDCSANIVYYMVIFYK